MLGGSAWASRGDRAFASVEYPQQRPLAEWERKRARRRAELAEKTARRQAEFTALLPAIAAQVAADVSAAVAAALQATRAEPLKELDLAPTTTTTSIISESSTSIQMPGGSSSISTTGEAASASHDLDLPSAVPVTCSTECPRRDNGSSDATASVAASVVLDVALDISAPTRCLTMEPSPGNESLARVLASAKSDMALAEHYDKSEEDNSVQNKDISLVQNVIAVREFPASHVRQFFSRELPQTAADSVCLPLLQWEEKRVWPPPSFVNALALCLQFLPYASLELCQTRWPHEEFFVLQETLYGSLEIDKFASSVSALTSTAAATSSTSTVNSMTSLMLDDIQHISLVPVVSDSARPDVQLDAAYKLDTAVSHGVVPVKVFIVASTKSVAREDELRPLPWPSFMLSWTKPVLAAKEPSPLHVQDCNLIDGFHHEKLWDPGGFHSVAWNCQWQMVLVNCKGRLGAVHSMEQWSPLNGPFLLACATQQEFMERYSVMAVVSRLLILVVMYNEAILWSFLVSPNLISEEYLYLYFRASYSHCHMWMMLWSTTGDRFILLHLQGGLHKLYWFTEAATNSEMVELRHRCMESFVELQHWPPPGLETMECRTIEVVGGGTHGLEIMGRILLRQLGKLLFSHSPITVIDTSSPCVNGCLKDVSRRLPKCCSITPCVQAANAIISAFSWLWIIIKIVNVQSWFSYSSLPVNCHFARVPVMLSDKSQMNEKSIWGTSRNLVVYLVHPALNIAYSGSWRSTIVGCFLHYGPGADVLLQYFEKCCVKLVYGLILHAPGYHLTCSCFPQLAVLSSSLPPAKSPDKGTYGILMAPHSRLGVAAWYVLCARLRPTDNFSVRHKARSKGHGNIFGGCKQAEATRATNVDSISLYINLVHIGRDYYFNYACCFGNVRAADDYYNDAFFAQVHAGQDLYLDAYLDKVHIGNDYYIGVFLEQVDAICYLNLIKVCLDYGFHHDLNEVLKQVPWDPGGSTCHRLEVKPKIK